MNGNNRSDFLEKRRIEIEFGHAGDKDVPYSFTLPASAPQVMAWVKLLNRVQQGEIGDVYVQTATQPMEADATNSPATVQNPAMHWLTKNILDRQA